MTPRATYRLQFHKDFGFRDAARIAPYLAELGISHVYASPWLKARPGSLHGYDIVDHHALNPELGSQHDFEAMLNVFRANGLRQILDFVPNHMGVGGADNPLWLDVLEWGSNSVYAGWFDIEWEPMRPYLRDKVLVPFLGDQYGVELYAGKLALKFDARNGSFAVWAYGAHKLPICPLHYGRILGDSHPLLERLGDNFATLPDWRPQVDRRAYELKQELAKLASELPDVKDAIAEALARFQGKPGDEQSWQRLNELIQVQHWRAADFRVASDDINYRRFFNINDLAGLRMEIPAVFDHAHSLAFRLLDSGAIDGLRIDHIDGLLDPKGYLQRLRTHGGTTEMDKEFYLVVEKILARHEGIREDWPVDGTTGYEFANQVLGLLIDPAGETGFSQAYTDFTGLTESFVDIVRECKLRIMRNELASELEVLGRHASLVARQNPRTADFTHNLLRRAIRQVVASFPVYRTYVDFEGRPSDDDRRDITWAVKLARAVESDIDPSVYDFIQNFLTGDLVAHTHSGFSRHAVLLCAMKLQQFSGPVMAKGLEDTAFYRYNRFIALNEVGGYPDQFGINVPNFHKANAYRAKRWPNCMLSTSTHDTKRGEDVRARLAVLSELPQEWAAQVQTWRRMLRARAGDIEAVAPPDRNDEYLFYQLLVGSWPAELTGDASDVDALKTYLERLKTAMIKCMREAKVHSTWALPGQEYENAVLAFVEGALDPERSSAFFAAFLPFQERIARLGVENSLVQTTLKLTSPGMPDIYQGADLWDLSLMDPDNRRPVDYDRRRRLLDGHKSTQGRPVIDLLRNWRDGAIKMLVTSRLLRFRTKRAQLFAKGEYEVLPVTGAKCDRACAFARRDEDECILVAVARFPVRREIDPDWADAAIPIPERMQGRPLRNLFTGSMVPADGAQLPAASAFAELPVAVLTAQ